METTQITCCLRDVKSFHGVFPSNLLPRSIARTGTVIINADSHTEKRFSLVSRSPTNAFLHSLLFRLVRTASIYSLHTLLPYAKLLYGFATLQLEELTSSVCGQYCCLFALYMDRGYTPKHFVFLIDTAKSDAQISRMFEEECGTLRRLPRGKEQCCCSFY
jgi:hypothetical protein